jgi:2-dehydropantoate 2-reductase
MSGPRILIQGIGGIGGVMAARLIRAGQDPVLVTGNPDIAASINESGLRVIEGKATDVVPARAVATLSDLTMGSRFDVSLLVMKANPVVAVAEETLPHLADDGYLVTCQNGVVEDAVAEAVGAERVVSAIIGWGGTMHAPGVCEKTGPGEIHLGELDGRITDRVRTLGAILEEVTPVVVCDNIRGALWSKLGINCMITTLGAVTGQLLGEMLSDRRAREAFLVIYREVADTARALGITLERIAVNPRLFYMPETAGPVTRLAKDLLARLVGVRYRRLKSSMLQSLERGRPTEVDFLNGYVAQKAAEAGAEAPLNAAVTRMVHEIEQGARPIEPANMEDLLAVIA